MLLRHFTTGTLPVSILAVPGIAIEAPRTHTQALSLVTALESKQGTAVVGTKDISWLWRTAYNTAIQGCSEWENYEDSISDLFDIARQVGRRDSGPPCVCPILPSPRPARASSGKEYRTTLTYVEFADAGNLPPLPCGRLRDRASRVPD